MNRVFSPRILKLNWFNSSYPESRHRKHKTAEPPAGEGRIKFPSLVARCYYTIQAICETTCSEANIPKSSTLRNFLIYFLFIYLFIFSLIPISNSNLEKRADFNALVIRLAPAQLYREGGNRKKRKMKEAIHPHKFILGMPVIQSQCKAEMQTSKTTLPSFKFNLSINVLVFDSFWFTFFNVERQDIY